MSEQKKFNEQDMRLALIVKVLNGRNVCLGKPEVTLETLGVEDKEWILEYIDDCIAIQDQQEPIQKYMALKAALKAKGW